MSETFYFDPSPHNGIPYASGEYRTNDHFQYGLYEVRMKPSVGNGVMSDSLFTNTGLSEGNPWDESNSEKVTIVLDIGAIRIANQSACRFLP